MKSIRRLAIQSLCSTGAVLTWDYAGEPALGFEIERQQTFDDQTWHRVATVLPSGRRYESTGLLGGAGRAWGHRIRAVGDASSGPWTEAGPIIPPDSPGGPRGRRIVAPTAEAPRNISGSFIDLANGEMLYCYTASSGMGDYARSWLPAMALTPDGNWEDRGVIFPWRNDWPVISRPSFWRLPDRTIGVTYSIGKPKGTDANEDSTTAFVHRTVFRTSADEARTWSGERAISDDLYDYELVNSNGARNLVLSNGRLLTNIHVCKPPALTRFDPFAGKNIFNEVMGTYLLLSDDNGRTWQRVPGDKDKFFFVPDDPYGRKRIGFWEIAVAEYRPGMLVMFGRNASGWLFETRSGDFGSTWSPPRQTNIPYPIAPPNITVIPGTSTLVFIGNPHVSYTNAFDGGFRSILATQLSEDGGITWHGYRELEYDGITADPFWSLYSYPDFAWRGDTLHVVYSRKFEELYHHALTKNWLLGRE